MLKPIPSSRLKSAEKSTERVNFASTHASDMVEGGSMDAREINKWADALCMDPQIVKSVVWSEIADICKDQIVISKPFITVEEIKKLPEFKQFLSDYMAEKGRLYETTLVQEKQKHKKELAASIGIAPDLQEKREKINRIKTAVRALISEKDEKSRGSSAFMSDVIKMSSGDAKIANANILYEFIYESFASPSEKKKRKPDEDAAVFYKRTGIDYSFKKIRERITGEESKINTQVAKQKTKEVTKLDSKKPQIQGKILDQKIYEEEAFNLFCKTGVLEDRYYLEKDKSDIEHLQNFFRDHIQKTKQESHQLNIDHGTYTESIKWVIKKTQDSIVLSPDDYIQLQVRYKSLKELFVNGDWTIKWYLFDRLIECVWYDVLEHEIKANLDAQPQYRGTTFDLYKTEFLDDTFAGADYFVEFMFPKTKTPQIAVIDLFVSDKKPDSEWYINKKKKTIEPKIPYSMYMNLFAQSNQNQYTMKPLSRYLEQQSPKLIHSLLKRIMEDQSFDINTFLSEQQQKAKVVGKIQSWWTSSQNIVRELEKLSA